MTYRERREARAARLRGWAEKRYAKAETVNAWADQYRGRPVPSDLDHREANAAFETDGRRERWRYCLTCRALCEREPRKYGGTLPR